jgi:hypothetical protein
MPTFFAVRPAASDDPKTRIADHSGLGAVICSGFGTKPKEPRPEGRTASYQHRKAARPDKRDRPVAEM